MNSNNNLKIKTMNNAVKFWSLQINKVNNLSDMLLLSKTIMEAIKYQQINSEDSQRVIDLLENYSKMNNIK